MDKPDIGLEYLISHLTPEDAKKVLEYRERMKANTENDGGITKLLKEIINESRINRHHTRKT